MIATLFRVLGAALLLSGSAFAQFSPGGGFNMGVKYPTNDPFYRRAVFGDFDGSLLQDLAYSFDDELWVQYDPGMMVAKSSIFSGCTDFDRIPVFSGSSRLALAVVSPQGLYHLHFTPGSTPFWSARAVDQSAAFTGATLVRVGDVDANGDPDLIGFNQAMGQIHFRLWDGSDWGSSPAFPPLTVSGALEDLLVIDAVGVPGVNLVLMEEDALRIVTTGGVQLLAQAAQSGLESRGLARVRQSNGSRDWIVWLTGEDVLPNVDQELWIGNETGGTVTTVPGGRRARNVSSADFDGDGLWDLAVNFGQTYEVGVVTNSGGTAPVFDFAADLQLLGIPGHSNDPALGPAHNGAMPLLFDVDGDMDRDLVCPFEENLEAGKDIFIARSLIVDQNDYKVDLAEQPGSNQPVHALLTAGSPSSTLQVTLAPPPVTGNATHIELRIFRKPAPTALLEADYFHREFRRLDGSSSYVFDVDLLEPGLSFDSIWMWNQRLVRRANGATTQVYPAKNMAFGHNPDNSQIYRYLESITEFGASVLPVDTNPALMASGGNGGTPPIECTGDHPDTPPRD